MNQILILANQIMQAKAITIIKGAVMGAILLLTPIKPLILAVGGAIALDTILGVHKAWKIGEKITSRRLSHIISKFALYQAAVILIYVIDLHLLGEFTDLIFDKVQLLFTKIVAIILIFIEGVSIKENFEQAFKIDVFDKLKTFFRRANELRDEAKRTF